MNSADLFEEINRLMPFSEEPVRQPMSRGVQFPTPGTKLLSLEQDLMRTRAALRDALAMLRLCAVRKEEDEQKAKDE